MNQDDPIGEIRRIGQEAFAAIVDSAMDAIIVTDEKQRIVLTNKAADDAFQFLPGMLEGASLSRFISDRFRDLLEVSMTEFAKSGWSRHYIWAEALIAKRSDGEPFPVDVTVSPFEFEERRYLTLILRNINIRRRAERRFRDLQRENARLKALIRPESGTADMIGVSAAMQRLKSDIGRVAPTAATVLITGETGTGKELVARAVHQASGRKNKALVVVNCAALSAGLVESELFGHEKGAFTGAIARKSGRFELADQGTLFLDEIGEFLLDLQAKLLRVLQEGEFERVGGVTTRKVDVRVIAATNRDLAQEVDERSFREDLYYRLNVFPIRVPALRERLDDIAPLAAYFVAKYSRKTGRPVSGIDPKVMDALKSYGWPGNVRELEHIIERGVILNVEPDLKSGDWLPRGDDPPPTRSRGTLREAEREHILAALESTGWKVSGRNGAAKLLGLKATTLEARMRKLGIHRPR
ncbi:MAG: sigma 54-interacting transcriptional regulator [Methylococcaceae bacterium]|nr:sigma 54-interacting transcriptional regulator [Methylococcaceae bacterium]